MQYIFLVVLLCQCYSADSRNKVYYILPDHASSGNCILNDVVLNPCYTFHQLISSEVLIYPYEPSVALVLLASGTYNLQNNTFEASGLNKIVIRPLIEQSKLAILISCEDAGFVFQDIDKVEIVSSHFTHCALKYTYNTTRSSLDKSIYVTKSVFENARGHGAVLILNRDKSVLNVTISHCTFLSNKGGILTMSRYQLIYLQIADTIFQNNWNDYSNNYYRGFALDLEWTVLRVYKSQFINNSNGAIKAVYSSLFLESTFFVKNFALSSIYLFSSNMSTCYCNFDDNTGPITVHRSQSLSFNSCVFQGNLAKGNGGALSVSNANLSLTNCQFYNNSALSQNHAITGMGGALYAFSSKTTIENSTFQSNSADSGGAFYFLDSLHFASRAKCYIKNSTLIFNEAEYNGGAIYCKNYKIAVESGSSISNHAENGNGGFVSLFNCHLDIVIEYNISQNTASKGGAIYANGSRITNTAEATMSNNMAIKYGGAMYLANHSEFGYIPFGNETLTFTHNVVTSDTGKGGAIYVLDSNCEHITYNSTCFLYYDDFLYNRTKYFIFSNNSAHQGPVLYGGLLERCYEPSSNSLGIDFMKQVSKYEPTPQAITSDPVRVCLCNNDDILNCAVRELSIARTSGDLISLKVAVVDQDQNLKASVIIAEIAEVEAALDGEAKTRTDARCTNLSYHVFTSNTLATLILQPKGFCKHSVLSVITINITVTDCPIGFEKINNICECERRLKKLKVDCNSGTNSIQNIGMLWLRYYEEHLQVHTHCPLDFCNTTSDIISLAHPDEQCANHHSGVICGACQDNFSMPLGTSKCLQCASSYAFTWLIPVFAVAGIALVALLLVCNMTISHGTLNGLIFYANVISISGLTSPQNCSIHPILSVFIAWVNLDLGVETCFYSGMDTYQKTWLQLAFPLYLWLLVGAIIIASYYSSTAMKIFGRNNVAVLATLFLLSYTKILKTIITVFDFTEVLQANAHNVSDPLVPYKVWTYDGNIEYLKGKHISLFSVALILLIFLFLPYTLLLTFGQCVRSMRIRKRCVLWCIRSTAFISIMDAYHAPYSGRHRYWTGLMLLTRCVLFLAFAYNNRNSELLTNMYTTILVLTLIFTLKMTFAKNVYKSHWMNILEICFLLNLVIFSVTLHHLRNGSNSDDKICKCASASISVSVVMFVGILAYHAYLRMNKMQWFLHIKNFILTKCPFRKPINAALPEEINVSKVEQKPTVTNVELREALLASVQ